MSKSTPNQTRAEITWADFRESLPNSLTVEERNAVVKCAEHLAEGVMEARDLLYREYLASRFPVFRQHGPQCNDGPCRGNCQ